MILGSYIFQPLGISTATTCVVLLSLLLVALLFVRNFCTAHRSVRSFDLRHKVVLTFDDGPNPHTDTTERLLDVLKKHNVPAYHCVVGQYARQYPDLVRQIASKGGILVNHSFSHQLPITAGSSDIRQDYEQGTTAILAALEDPAVVVSRIRPAYAVVTPAMRKYAASAEQKILPFTISLDDFNCGPSGKDDVVKRLLAAIRKDDGGIVVLHEGRYHANESQIAHLRDDPSSGYNRSWIPGAVDELITELKADGFEFVTLE
ncbi:MAG: polysaccharide deacetylase family protein [Phycisphaerae bacterium]|jgi:peptidoglycan/xylan/chitin deacetylase (PgdA/CDA1 family)|nr:polysaccharide deacetylase family protein [Phycisphaerae bacterium]